MDVGEIRDFEAVGTRRHLVATVLPPREGFSPDAVGAIGLLVHRLGQPGDVVIGKATSALTFSGRRFVPAMPPAWPVLGRVDRYIAGVARTISGLNPALIEVHNRANLARRLARAQKNARVVLFVHNDPQGMRQAKTPADRAAILKQLTVVCVSTYLRDRFMDGLDPDGPAPIVLPNALDLTEIPPLLPPESREKTILFVGRVVSDKGADAFVQACALTLPNLHGWRAVMIGADGFHQHGKTSAFERQLRPLADKAGIERHGYQRHAQVLDAMAKAAIVAVPSRWPEPFGLTALEAMACGAALICGPRGGLPDLAGDAALYADPDTPGALASAIHRLATNAPLRTTLTQNGLTRAQTYNAADARLRLTQLRSRLLGT